MIGALVVYRWELRKLVSQKRTYLGLGAAIAVPLIFVVALTLQNGQPNDVAFGRYVRESGLAIPLVLLLFGSIWLVPLITALVAGGERADIGTGKGYFVQPTVFADVTPEMTIAREEIFGPVLSVVRAGTYDEALNVINANPYGNGTAIFTASGEAARRFQRGVHVGMIGINVPIPVPMAYYSFGGWKDSLFGDKHIHGPEGVSFYTRGKVITSRWPHVEHATGASLHFPTAS